MLTPLIITDVTRMAGHRVCVAGITENGQMVRPVFPNSGIPEDWLITDGKEVIRPFSKVILDLRYQKQVPPHTEDWIIDPEVKRFVGMASGIERLEILKQTLVPYAAEAFGASIHNDHGFFINKDEGLRSLSTIKVKTIDFVRHDQINNTFRYRVSFIDQNDDQYELTATDLSFRYYVDTLRETENWSCGKIGAHFQHQFSQWITYLRIGLGRPWHPDSNQPKNRHYLQINGIYTFPDYLFGKSFLDFLPGPRETDSAEVDQGEMIPF